MIRKIYKIGEDIDDEEGWRQVVDISNDGYVTFVNREGNEWSDYFAQHDKSISNSQYRGVIVKLTNRKDFDNYTIHYFSNKSVAKYFAKNQVKNKKAKYYRVEDAILTNCKRCNKPRLISEDICLYCSKLRE